MATMFTAVRTRLLLEAARLRVKQMGLETLAGAPSVYMALGELVNHSEFLEGKDLWEGCHGRIPRFSTVALWTFQATPSFVVGGGLMLPGLLNSISGLPLLNAGSILSPFHCDNQECL